MLALNGSSAGARPKGIISLDGDDWIIKFRALIDSEDTGATEYAYHLMAKAAGLEVAEAKLFPSKHCPGYFGTKRFDRIDGQRIHMHSMSGLCHIDHRLPFLDYETIIKATKWLTKSQQETEKQFRAAVFNALSHNRDDHAKNFSFLMNTSGQWRVSPAYDLTFSSGPMGEHSTIFLGEGKNPGLEHLLKLAEIGNSKQTTALEIIDQVKAAIARWPEFSEEAEVGATQHKLIHSKING